MTHQLPKHAEHDASAARRRPGRATAAAALTHSQRNVLHLQRSIGNRATQQMLTGQSSLQRAVELDEVQVSANDEPAPQPAPSNGGGNAPAQPGGDGRMTKEEFFAQVKDSTVILTNPMIGFAVGDTFGGFPAKVESFDSPPVTS
jgi:hypothetical protein